MMNANSPNQNLLQFATRTNGPIQLIQFNLQLFLLLGEFRLFRGYDRNRNATSSYKKMLISYKRNFK